MEVDQNPSILPVGDVSNNNLDFEEYEEVQHLIENQTEDDGVN